VLPPVVGILGSLQALETLKVLTGIGRPLVGRLLVFDGLALEWRTLRLRRDPACPVCGVAQ
jgi:adenylyltransferase/sulfurtransferase